MARSFGKIEATFWQNPRDVVLAPPAPLTLAERMAGRRYEDVKLRPRALAPAPQFERRGAQSSLA